MALPGAAGLEVWKYLEPPLLDMDSAMSRAPSMCQISKSAETPLPSPLVFPLLLLLAAPLLPLRPAPLLLSCAPPPREPPAFFDLPLPPALPVLLPGLVLVLALLLALLALKLATCLLLQLWGRGLLPKSSSSSLQLPLSSSKSRLTILRPAPLPLLLLVV